MKGVATEAGELPVLDTLLSWPADRPRGAFAVAASNDASMSPAELTRSGRFDAAFCLDRPAAEERPQIWDRYRAEYGIDDEDLVADDEGWTGAEIESCCRLSALQASRWIRPPLTSCRSARAEGSNCPSCGGGPAAAA
ncbi:hypothetical protein [Alienimonas chondri]|uniref:hypothetical protein n=1 Tax=Alienimonas chondri TaxID=2681879 RepID=UPI00148941D9|nr:hypothetical protein [Alienimonas chondri]